jgi:hypothetical protein
MTWYFWVWGTLSCLVLLVALVVGGIGLEELWKRRKSNNYTIQELRYENNNLEAKLARCEAKCAQYRRQIAEMRKGRNEFGDIHP